MSYRVEIAARAYADLFRLTEWLAERSPGTADQITERFYDAIPRLETHPLSCGLAYENRFVAEEIRHLLFKVTKKRQYRALFVVRGDVVKVLAIRAPGEKPLNQDDING